MKLEKAILSFILSFALVSPVFAEGNKSLQDSLPDSLSDSLSGAITGHCDSLRQTFHSIQVSDASTRSYLGHIYEVLIADYMKPLNKRLVDSSIVNPSLVSLQGEFITARIKFNSDFIAYSQSLEELISIDCKTSPESFVKSLSATREKRSAVSSDVKFLENLLAKYRSSVVGLKKSLKDPDAASNTTEKESL